MSIKIYNGYRFKNNLSLIELNERVKKLRIAFTKELLEEYKKQLMKLIYLNTDLYQIDKDFYFNHIDESSCVKIPNDKHPFVSIALNTTFELRDKVMKAISSMHRSFRYDYSANLQIYPIKDKVLFQLFCEKDLEWILLQQEDIEEYIYQNQTDKPNDITEQEWEQRYDDWKCAMPDWTYNKNGFNVSLFSTDDIPFQLSSFFEDNEYDYYKKSLEQRARAVAQRYFSYPKFDGTDISVFLDKDYQDFLKEKSYEIILKLENAVDPLREVYAYYKGV